MPVDKGRLHKELADVQRDKGSGVTVEILDDQLSHLKGTLKGALCARRQVWWNSARVLSRHHPSPRACVMCLA